MELITTQECNDFTWTGLTLGKLLAIMHALEDVRAQARLSPVQYDVLTFLWHNLKQEGE